MKLNEATPDQLYADDKAYIVNAHLLYYNKRNYSVLS